MEASQNGPRHKGFYILPNLLTTASLFSGFLGMVWAIDGKFGYAALAILASCFLDGMDGAVARMTRSSSKFGVQFDSLADLVSFGVSPALLVFLWQTHQFGRLGIAASFLFIACGALRLARFNVQTSTSPKSFFVGLPIPAAACTLATLVLFTTVQSFPIPEAVLSKGCLLLIYLLSLLMVSKVRYASLKDVEMVRAHPFTSTAAAIMLFGLVASEPRLLGFFFFLGYMVSGPLYTFLVLPLRRGGFLRGLSARSSRQ